jgi:hypothetical protein
MPSVIRIWRSEIRDKHTRITSVVTSPIVLCRRPGPRIIGCVGHFELCFFLSLSIVVVTVRLTISISIRCRSRPASARGDNTSVCRRMVV